MCALSFAIPALPALIGQLCPVIGRIQGCTKFMAMQPTFMTILHDRNCQGVVSFRVSRIKISGSASLYSAFQKNDEIALPGAQYLRQKFKEVHIVAVSSVIECSPLHSDLGLTTEIDKLDGPFLQTATKNRHTTPGSKTAG